MFDLPSTSGGQVMSQRTHDYGRAYLKSALALFLADTTASMRFH